MSERVLAFRFDVDSVRCAEEGIPALRRAGDRVGTRFSFFVNMGYSFNWSHYLRHALRKRSGGQGTPGIRRALPVRAKLGIRGILKTVVLNPRLGERYRAVFDGLHEDGHELALHGGTDHVIWQRSLGRLDPGQLEALLLPAYRVFADRYGPPTGFASPGFQTNDAVMELVDRLGFTYASDLPGVHPYRPTGSGGEERTHYQVPVNVAAEQNVPLIEACLHDGLDHRAIVERCIEAIRRQEFALMYGHPYVEGVHARVIEDIVGALAGEYDVVTVEEYLARWRQAHHG